MGVARKRERDCFFPFNSTFQMYFNSSISTLFKYEYEIKYRNAKNGTRSFLVKGNVFHFSFF